MDNSYYIDCAIFGRMPPTDVPIKPMPWIGLYAAVASLICSIGMAADTFHAVRSKKFWFPSKFFGLNATTLTLLAVGTKLSVDLNTELLGKEDQLSKLSTTIFLSTAMGNCLTSLGSMDNQSILMNVTALIILLVTVIVNISIQIWNNVADYSLYCEYILATIAMLVLLLVYVSSALSVPTTKIYIEAKYQEIHQIASDDQQDELRKFTAENLKSVIRRYWVMAATGNPQFVMARSSTCTTCGVICLLIAFTFVEAAFRIQWFDLLLFCSDYEWSTACILAVQSLGITVGTIAPAFRLFSAVLFKWSEKGRKSWKNELKAEKYWTQKLEDWQKISLPLSIRGTKIRKLVHDIKHMTLSLCIKVQIAIVLTSKFIGLLFTCILRLFQLFLSHIRILKVESEPDSESERGHEMNSYVLLLEGEVGLPRRTLEKIFSEVDQLILTGKRKQPKFLINLLDRSSSYNGIADFDSDQVPSLHSEEPPNSWTLPVVTLASIAIAIPSIQSDKAGRLLKGVSQGLRYANLIEKCLKTIRDFGNISNSADIVWVGVELYHKWLDVHLHALKGKTSREILEMFAENAERSITKFKTNTDGELMKNPIHWPFEVIAANSMYRISRTLLIDYEGDNQLTDEELFEKLSTMIGDIFAACLSSLPRLIIMKCHCDAIENREASVREAALLLGESEKILGILQQRDLSGRQSKANQLPILELIYVSCPFLQTKNLKSLFTNLLPLYFLLRPQLLTPLPRRRTARKNLAENFCEVDQLILTGKNQLPKYLLEILEKFKDFHGVADFDIEQVPSIYSKETPNCWTLPVVTLASIAIALPNIQSDKAHRLLRSVSQGLRYAEFTERYQNTKRDFINIRNAADIVWVGLEVTSGWMRTSNFLMGRPPKKFLKALLK
ncbi:hypothetical protein ACH5RR_038655 [Cinchona calisaya]|uniref:Uncharacterized protein n=1 Tax=Cinchona calisaya TaxID=153742 RepID=A0ABD2Y173_9GENT